MDKSKMKNNQVFRVIDTKINELEREYSRPGWNVWLVGSALVACVWIFLSYLEKFQGSWQLIGVFSVSFYLIGRVLITLLTASRSVLTPTKNLHVKYSKNLFGSAKRIVVVEFAYLVLLIYLLNVITVQGWIRVLGNTFFSIFGFFAVIFLILAFVRYPYVVSPQKKRSVFTVTLGAFFVSIPIVIGLGILLPHISSVSIKIPEIRISAAIALFAILFRTLVFLSKQNPLVFSLRELRSDVTFGVLNSFKANERLELILLGFRLEQAVDNELSSVLGLIHEATSVFDRIGRHYDLMKSSSNDLPDEKSDDIINAASDAIERCIDKLSNLLESLEKAIDRLFVKLVIIRKQCEDPIEVDQLFKEVQKEFKLLKESSVANRTKIDSYRKDKESEDQQKTIQIPE